jgi:hypothetical protein
MSGDQGITQLWTYPQKSLLIGWTTPKGDILLYDVSSGTLKTVPGISQEFGKEVGREILVSPQGRIYFNYSPLDVKPENQRVYVYDLLTDTTTATPYVTPHYGGCWPRDIVGPMEWVNDASRRQDDLLLNLRAPLPP